MLFNVVLPEINFINASDLCCEHVYDSFTGPALGIRNLGGRLGLYLLEGAPNWNDFFFLQVITPLILCNYYKMIIKTMTKK